MVYTRIFQYVFIYTGSHEEECPRWDYYTKTKHQKYERNCLCSIMFMYIKKMDFAKGLLLCLADQLL